jgi:hypothetical protein
MQFILDHPEQWDQSVWSNTCGTAYCFAGHASILAGSRQLQGKDYYEDSNSTEWLELVVPPPELWAKLGNRGWATGTVTGEDAWAMSDVAQAALGIDRCEDDDLFDSENSLGDLLHILREWATADGVELPESWPTNEPLRNLHEWGSSVDEY